MNRHNTVSPRWDDIVFENRNRAYGAYAIRKIYTRHIAVAMLLSVLLVGAVIGYPSIARYFGDGKKEVDVPLQTIRYTDLAQPPSINKNVPPPKKIDVPQVKKVVKFLPPNVTEKEVREEEEMPRIEDLNVNEPSLDQISAGAEVISDQPVAKVLDNTADPEEIFVAVEQAPEYEGGLDAMYKFLQKNLRYPAKARRMNIQGTVYLSFVVERDGSIADVQVIKGIDQECDQEAARVISAMPKWNPGKQGGRPVRVRFVLPIKFKLAS
ncbi:MAG: TonB family protein [Cyclobacteriaceae bacterium]|jgi:protein TonB|nr:TonB family protein [Cyclobacteriaceae bacterium]